MLSTQVLQEFFATVTKTLKQGVPISATRKAILAFSDTANIVSISVPLIVAATRRVETAKLSFWDSLIIESAIGSGARRLWTEDLQDGQTFGRLMIVNPFKSPTK